MTHFNPAWVDGLVSSLEVNGEAVKFRLLPDPASNGSFSIHSFCHKGVFWNRGTPKSSILIGISIINHPFWGTPIFGNTHKPLISWNKSGSIGYTFFPPQQEKKPSTMTMVKDHFVLNGGTIQSASWILGESVFVFSQFLVLTAILLMVQKSRSQPPFGCIYKTLGKWWETSTTCPSLNKIAVNPDFWLPKNYVGSRGTGPQEVVWNPMQTEVAGFFWSEFSCGWSDYFWRSEQQRMTDLCCEPRNERSPNFGICWREMI